MARNLRTLCIALMAIVALGAATASLASAQKFSGHWEKDAVKTTEKPDGKLKWKFDLGTEECEEYGEGVLPEAEEGIEQVLDPTSETCTDPELEAFVDIDYNACRFVYRPATIENGKYEGTMDISCEGGGESIDITAEGCTIEVLPQEGLKKVTYVNKGVDKGRYVTVELNITGVTYIEQNVGMDPTCKDSGKAKTNGTITGNKILEVDNAKGEMRGFWVA